MNITTTPFTFIEILTLVLILGGLLLLIIFKGRISMKNKYSSISLNGHFSKNDAKSLSPHHNCANRFQFTGIFRGFQFKIEELHKLMFSTIVEKQRAAVKIALEVYYVELVGTYKDELIKRNIPKPTEYWDYKYFKLIAKEIVTKMCKVFDQIIKNNGFLEFKDSVDSFNKYKLDILTRVSTTLSSELDIYYIGTIGITREELDKINDPDKLLQRTVYGILDKILAISLDCSEEMEAIRSDISVYSLDRLGINVYKSADQNRTEQTTRKN